MTEASDTPRRSSRSTVALVVAALVLTVVVGVWANRDGERPAPVAPTRAAPPSTPTGGHSPPPPRLLTIASTKPVGIGRQSLSVEGIPLSFSIPSRGWSRAGGLYVSKSTAEPDNAEAILFWTVVSGGTYADACGQWWGSPVGSVADWAAVASRKRGTELIEGPQEVTIGGYAAQHVEFTIRRDVGCNPGFFHTWKAVDEAPFWSATEVGDTIRIWLVQLGGKVLFIEGDTHEDADADLKLEVESIVASVGFD